ncbi:phage tail protein [Ralstonia sp. CHL-2022]|uniref:Phage tail protein n=1 Tax=Ralstonia mojiangensis TaxID=2953895 RepID=A0AAE3I534_9RALS|nr:phage tail protein [Ralstonia mojiangensis]MCT7316748.1 phage tail protein [Ralstonia mojiangensis]
MSQTFFVLPTAAGEARDANAKALGLPRRYTHMAVGDGGGALPTPDRNRTALVGEHHRAPLNALWQDPGNPSQFVAELVIPETVGGWWIRELGLYDEDGTLCYYGNCPETYKPQMAEGSGRTQSVRMVVLSASGVPVALKIDPSIVLATRQHVDKAIADLINGAPKPLDTLGELAAAIGNDADFAGTLARALAEKADRTELKDLVNGAPARLDTLGELAVAIGNDPDFSGTIARALAEKVSRSELYDLGTGPDFSVSIAGGSGNTLSTHDITKPKGVYLILPYNCGWTHINVDGSYFMTAFGWFMSGTGSCSSINLAQTGAPIYDQPPIVLRITSPSATFRLGLKNNGSVPPNRGTITITPGVNGVSFTGYRIA